MSSSHRKKTMFDCLLEIYDRILLKSRSEKPESELQAFDKETDELKQELKLLLTNTLRSGGCDENKLQDVFDEWMTKKFQFGRELSHDEQAGHTAAVGSRTNPTGRGAQGNNGTQGSSIGAYTRGRNPGAGSSSQAQPRGARSSRSKSPRSKPAGGNRR